jgi:hypothetical protein
VRGFVKFLTVTMTCAVLAGGLARGASADSLTPITQVKQYVEQVVPDPKLGYLFLSADGAIVVTDLAGKYLTTVDSGAGIKKLALSADGTLYAAVTAGANANSVAFIDASTITAAAPAQVFHPLPTGDIPFALALQSGQLWVSYQTPTYAGAIGAMDPASGAFTPSAAPFTWVSYAPDLAADPSDTGVLLADDGLEPTTAATFNTATVPAAKIAAAGPIVNNFAGCSYAGQSAVTPGGQQVVLACSNPQGVLAFSASTLLASVPATYPTGATGIRTLTSTRVAVASDGTVAAANYALYTDGQSEIRVYRPDGTLLNVFNLGKYTVASGESLFWMDTASGPELLAVVEPNDGTTAFSIQTFTQPGATRATMTLAVPSKAAFHSPITISGKLSLGTGGALPVGSTITVTRTGPGGSVTLKPAAVSASGTFTVTDTPAALGSYTYTASYIDAAQAIRSVTARAPVTVMLSTSKLTFNAPAVGAIYQGLTIKGELAFLPGTVPAGVKLSVTRTAAGTTKKVFTVRTAAGGSFTITDRPTVISKYTYAVAFGGNIVTSKTAASVIVPVAKGVPDLSITAGATQVSYLTTLHVTAHLGATYSNRSIAIYARPAGSKSAALLKSGRVNSAGVMTVGYTGRWNTTFSVKFTGDARYAARAVATSVGVRAAVTMKVSGSYASTTSGGIRYLLFHRSGRLDFSVTVTPNKSRQCAEVEAEEYFNGGWHFNTTTGCAALDLSSRVSGYFTLSNADLGYPFRIQAQYQSSDKSNLSSTTTWLYFMVEP